jgi:hypothetical protein
VNPFPCEFKADIEREEDGRWIGEVAGLPGEAAEPVDYLPPG